MFCSWSLTLRACSLETTIARHARDLLPQQKATQSRRKVKTREGDLVDARLLRASVRLQVALLAPQQSLIAQGYESARRDAGMRKRTMCRAPRGLHGRRLEPPSGGRVRHHLLPAHEDLVAGDSSVAWPARRRQQVTYSIYPRKNCKVPSEVSDVAEQAGKNSCFRPRRFEALPNDVRAHTQPRTPELKCPTQRTKAQKCSAANSMRKRHDSEWRSLSNCLRPARG